MGHASRVNPPADGESLATFVGANWDLYARKWNAADATGSKHGWNWPAFLIGPIWIIYRKMYKNAAILVGFYFLLGILEAMGVPAGLTGIMQLAVAITVAMFANHGYRQFVEERVAQIARTTQESALKAELARQGGTNMGGAIGFAVAMFVLFVFGVLAESL